MRYDDDFSNTSFIYVYMEYLFIEVLAVFQGFVKTWTSAAALLQKDVTRVMSDGKGL